MNRFAVALEKAERLGHKLEEDRPLFSSVRRKTCRVCGRVVIGNEKTAYGSALDEQCTTEGDRA